MRVERIKELRSLIGLGQVGFAEKLKIHRSKLARIEAGDENPPKSLLNSICIVFNVRMEWLLNGIEPIFAHGTNLYSCSEVDETKFDHKLKAVIEAVELHSQLPLNLKASVIAYYYEHYNNISISAEEIREEIANSIIFVAELLGGKK